MSFQIKTRQELFADMRDSVLTTGKLEDIGAGSATKALLSAIEMDMFYGPLLHEIGLRKTLRKLGIKSANIDSLTFGAPLQMESLQATLSQVTFDNTKLKLWSKPK